MVAYISIHGSTACPHALHMCARDVQQNRPAHVARLPCYSKHSIVILVDYAVVTVNLIASRCHSDKAARITHAYWPFQSGDRSKLAEQHWYGYVPTVNLIASRCHSDKAARITHAYWPFQSGDRSKLAEQHWYGYVPPCMLDIFPNC